MKNETSNKILKASIIMTLWLLLFLFTIYQIVEFKNVPSVQDAYDYCCDYPKAIIGPHGENCTHIRNYILGGKCS